MGPRIKKSVAKLVIPESATIRAALEALGAENSCQIAFTCDSQSKITGCITDGDIRRGLLRGETLDSNVTGVCRRNFVSASKGTKPAELLSLMRKRGVRQIPILDAAGKLLDVKTLDALTGARPDAVPPIVIMAGGRGSRLLPYTETVPKPLLMVGDQSVIGRLVSVFRAKGARDFYVSVNHLADQIIDHLGNGDRFDCRIEYIREAKPLGTAGSLGLLKGRINRNFLVINGDVISSTDVALLTHFHEEHDAIATICAKVFNVKIPYGVVRVDGGRVTAIEEKPELSFTVNAGIYLLSPRVFEWVGDSEHLDMTTLLERLIAAGQTVKCFESPEPWVDIGSYDEFQRAQKFLEYL